MEEAKNPIKLPKGRETPYVRYKSVEDFVDYVSGDDRDDYTHEELADLAYSLKRSRSDLRKELEGYGLKLAAREIPKRVRGCGSSDQDRWWGPGSGNESKMEESMLTAAAKNSAGSLSNCLRTAAGNDINASLAAMSFACISIKSGT